MINFATDVPIRDAIEAMGGRTPIGSMMSSAEWEATPLEIRDRSFWMARVINEQLLAEAQRRVLQAIKQQRDAVEAGGRLMERGRFVLEMQDILRQMGYKPDPAKAGGLQDLSSSRRLSLVWEMNLAMAQGHASWKAQQNAVSLRRAPAQELIRVASRIERRLWPRIWAAMGGKFYGKPGPDYPEAPGRMIALKTDPIWRKISHFGVPWPPFDWGSGMGLKSIRRAEALTLVDADGTKLIGPDVEDQKPENLSLNSGLKMSIKGVSDPGLERLRSEFGDAVRFDGPSLSYQRDLSPSNEHREKTVEEELRDRARSAFERGEKALGDGGRDRLAKATPGGEFPADAEREILVGGAAVETGRKALFHDEYLPGQSKAVADLLRETLDPKVRVDLVDGHVIAWRPDLLDLSPEQLIELCTGNPPMNGKLLGYGAETFGQTPRTQVLIRDKDGNVVFGFHGPFIGAQAFGEARLRDWTDATGDDYSLTLIPIEGGVN